MPDREGRSPDALASGQGSQRIRRGKAPLDPPEAYSNQLLKPQLRLFTLRRCASIAAEMKPMRPSGPRCSIPGLLVAVLALFSLVALRPAMPDPVAPQVLALQASPFGDIPICHAEAPGNPDGTEPSGHAHHGMACALCPACHALAAAAVVPDPGTPLPAPPVMPAARNASLPPARAPPAAAVLAATYPTGPPRLA